MTLFSRQMELSAQGMAAQPASSEEGISPHGLAAIFNLAAKFFCHHHQPEFHRNVWLSKAAKNGPLPEPATWL
jgi:hypothetical protein